MAVKGKKWPSLFQLGETFWRSQVLSWPLKCGLSYNVVAAGEPVQDVDIDNTGQGKAGPWSWDEARKVIGVRLQMELCQEEACGL